MVFKGHGKSEESSSVIPKPQAAKFLSKPKSGNSQCAPSTNSSTAGIQEYARITELDVQVHHPNKTNKSAQICGWSLRILDFLFKMKCVNKEALQGLTY
jgi:hypothetical protein